MVGLPITNKQIRIRSTTHINYYMKYISASLSKGFCSHTSLTLKENNASPTHMHTHILYYDNRSAIPQAWALQLYTSTCRLDSFHHISSPCLQITFAVPSDPRPTPELNVHVDSQYK